MRKVYWPKAKTTHSLANQIVKEIDFLMKNWIGEAIWLAIARDPEISQIFINLMEMFLNSNLNSINH
jgi:hypothetical protein